MAHKGRSFSKFPLSRWDEDRYLDLTPPAQQLYGILCTSPDINHAGIVDWRPERITAKSRNMPLDYVLDGAAELEATGWILIDGVTCEALIVDHIHDDEILRNPNNSIAIVRARAATASRVLKAAIITQLHHCRADEEQQHYSAWTSPISAGLLGKLLAQDGLDPAAYRPAYADRLIAIEPFPITRSSTVIANLSAIPPQTPPAMVTGTPSAIPSPAPSDSPSEPVSGPPSPTLTRPPSDGPFGYHPHPRPGPNPTTHPEQGQHHPEYHPEHHRRPTNSHEPATSGGYLPTVGNPRAHAGPREGAPAPAREPDPDPRPPGNPNPDTRPAKYHATHPDGYVDGCADCDAAYAAHMDFLLARRDAELADDPDDPEPALSCGHHDDDPHRACARCREARHRHGRWTMRRQLRLTAAAEAKSEAIAACARRCLDQGRPPMCDHNGDRNPPPELLLADYPVVRCDHRTTDLPDAWRTLLADTPTPERITTP